MTPKHSAWHTIGPISRIEVQVAAAMENVARGLSQMVGHTITTGTAQAKMIPLKKITSGLGHPETAMVGIYLLMEGELSGQALLVLPIESATRLADTMMGQKTSKSDTFGLDAEARSALAEVGNMAVAYFLNAMSSLTGKDLRPSPPAVMVDMLATVLNVIVATIGSVQENLMVIETAITDLDDMISAQFWVFPDLTAPHPA